MKFTRLIPQALLFACSVAGLSVFQPSSLLAQVKASSASLSATLYPSNSMTNNELNRRVYEYAIANLGGQIGNGECAFLIHNALVAAGARTFDQLGPTDLYSDYVWGHLVATITPSQVDFQALKVGDIIQFRNASTYEKVTKSDGSWKARRVEYNHHTSIIAEVDGTRLVLIHQNFGNNPATKKTVQKSPLDLATLKSGTLWVYRPMQ